MKNIMIVGVGGQGSLLMSRILGQLAQEEGYEVKVSEVHGMAQRGGSVVTFVRYGSQVEKPTIEAGEADLILALEELEGLRYLPFLKPTGQMILNEWRILPMPVLIEAEEYPKEEIQNMKQMEQVSTIKGMEQAKALGNPKVFNLVILGFAAKYLEFPLSRWKKAIEQTVPEKLLEMNQKAFLMGYQG